MGMSRPVHVLQRGAEVEEIVNIAAIAVVDTQETKARLEPEAGGKEVALEEPQQPARRLQPVHV